MSDKEKLELCIRLINTYEEVDGSISLVFFLSFYFFTFFFFGTVNKRYRKMRTYQLVHPNEPY